MYVKLDFDVENENPNVVYARNMVVWFEDEELFEEVIEEYRGASILGMINEVLPGACFMASWVTSWISISELEGSERVELKVARGMNLY